MFTHARKHYILATIVSGIVKKFSLEIALQSHMNIKWSSRQWKGLLEKNTLALTFCLTVLQIQTKNVSCHTADSKPVKQEVNGTVILHPWVFPALALNKYRHPHVKNIKCVFMSVWCVFMSVVCVYVCVLCVLWVCLCVGGGGEGVPSFARYIFSFLPSNSFVINVY